MFEVVMIDAGDPGPNDRLPLFKLKSKCRLGFFMHVAARSCCGGMVVNVVSVREKL